MTTDDVSSESAAPGARPAGARAGTSAAAPKAATAPAADSATAPATAAAVDSATAPAAATAAASATASAAASVRSSLEVLAAGPELWQSWRALRLAALRTDPSAFGSTYAQVLERDTPEYWLDVLRRPGRCVVARIGGEDAGMARIVPGEQPDDPAEIISVWVDRRFRGHGVGRAVIEACIDWAEENLPATRLRLSVRRTNEAAQNLYSATGFGIIGLDPEDDSEFRMERRAGAARPPVMLPTALVARYRAVDREEVGSPTQDTPAHLDALEVAVREEGITTPLDLAITDDVATLDGNHRIAVALRLGLREVPVHVTARPAAPLPAHAKPLDPQDLAVIREALAASGQDLEELLERSRR